MKLTLDALLTLDAIARRGSFSAAANELYRVPSALTYTVQKLEQDLGVTLFDRSGHRAKLTPAGEELLQEGRIVLNTIARMEDRVRKVATGWEAELRIAVIDLIPVDRLYCLLSDFYQENETTRIRLATEVLGGGWDALAGGRAELVVGAPGDMPAGNGFATHLMGTLDFVFAVAPNHPLAAADKPLARCDILAYRSVVAADTSRNLPPRTAGVLEGQDTLTVPDMRAKREAQRRGLGVGFLPRCMIQQDLARGTLVIKDVEEVRPSTTFHLAWRADDKGKALKWFVKRLKDMDLSALVSGTPNHQEPVQPAG